MSKELDKNSALLNTGALGLGLRFSSPGRHPSSAVSHRKLWKIEFDTGIVMYVPESIFMTMNFELQEEDPK